MATNFVQLSVRVSPETHLAIVNLARKFTAGNLTKAVELCIDSAVLLLVENPKNPMAQQILDTTNKQEMKK